MIGFIIRILINAFALLLIARLSEGAIRVSSFGAAFFVCLLIGVTGATVQPFLLKMANAVSCAFTCITFGLWSLFLTFLVNGLIFWLCAQFVEGFSVRNNNFWTAAFGALVLAIVNVFATSLTRGDKEK